MQPLLFADEQRRAVPPYRRGLLKWIGNKQRVAHAIASFFPADLRRYFEPFLGSAAVLATLTPRRAIGSDTFAPLMGFWRTLHADPAAVKRWYADRWRRMMSGDKVAVYDEILASYNASPNPADLLFLCRSCYGGVVRFRKLDGFMSTPCGAHTPIPPEAFAKRVDEWHRRTYGAEFRVMDYRDAMGRTNERDLVYCDPPYMHSQSILYGAQGFRFEDLLDVILDCKQRGVYVALSIDGTKRSGRLTCELPIPEGLFEREVLIDCGRSMLRRFQLAGQTLEHEVVADRLLLTY